MDKALVKSNRQNTCKEIRSRRLVDKDEIESKPRQHFERAYYTRGDLIKKISGTSKDRWQTKRALERAHYTREELHNKISNNKIDPGANQCLKKLCQQQKIRHYQPGILSQFFLLFKFFFWWSHNLIFLKCTNGEKCPDFENGSC